MFHYCSVVLGHMGYPLTPLIELEDDAILFVAMAPFNISLLCIYISYIGKRMIEKREGSNVEEGYVKRY